MERIVLVVDDNPELVDGVKLTLEMACEQIVSLVRQNQMVYQA